MRRIKEPEKNTRMCPGDNSPIKSASALQLLCLCTSPLIDKTPFLMGKLGPKWNRNTRKRVFKETVLLFSGRFLFLVQFFKSFLWLIKVYFVYRAQGSNLTGLVFKHMALLDVYFWLVAKWWHFIREIWCEGPLFLTFSQNAKVAQVLIGF